MQQVVEDIKTVIKDFGQDKKITLLAKGAVLSGEIPDYTQEIIKESLDNDQNQKTKKLKDPARASGASVSAPVHDDSLPAFTWLSLTFCTIFFILPRFILRI